MAGRRKCSAGGDSGARRLGAPTSCARPGQHAGQLPAWLQSIRFRAPDRSVRHAGPWARRLPRPGAAGWAWKLAAPPHVWPPAPAASSAPGRPGVRFGFGADTPGAATARASPPPAASRPSAAAPALAPGRPPLLLSTAGRRQGGRRDGNWAGPARRLSNALAQATGPTSACGRHAARHPPMTCFLPRPISSLAAAMHAHAAAPQPHPRPARGPASLQSAQMRWPRTDPWPTAVSPWGVPALMRAGGVSRLQGGASRPSQPYSA